MFRSRTTTRLAPGAIRFSIRVQPVCQRTARGHLAMLSDPRSCESEPAADLESRFGRSQLRYRLISTRIRTARLHPEIWDLERTSSREATTDASVPRPAKHLSTSTNLANPWPLRKGRVKVFLVGAQVIVWEGVVWRRWVVIRDEGSELATNGHQFKRILAVRVL